LRLVETDAKKAWAAYRVNDEVNIYVKYRLDKRETKKDKKMVWSFSLSGEELAKITELGTIKPVWLALVCGLRYIKPDSLKAMQVCLLAPDQIRHCVDMTADKTQTIAVEYKPGESLRAYGQLKPGEKQKLVVPRNRLDTWAVPGS
jgi:hypothetical protein